MESNFQEYINWLKSYIEIWRTCVKSSPDDVKTKHELEGLEMALQKAEYYLLEKDRRKQIDWERTWLKKIVGF